ncbi:similar to Saccharomyces cerevisiae YOR097C Putative protein of unknown function [Maudiozyma barnettii]|uniref:Uncharacterized protein n=1 Tax=Maudiozyma barnettii TaxID=61262 RepID=A0A8H2ZG59_9SACH|nr:uncharacterized protein KABA2_04S01518 [Kazachstania barnettii]CAB4254229.1 similar to Saccharomyces cerevisiae YOR097C Putative protein of unknown function [Kazachstania barnettii]CAD1781969.1 similar to Saccharomyces cerevisiae YOR097C Putative protein of unknown function [Kazachstania barnettii]
MNKYKIENIGGVHIPSFLLGLLGSILLYFLSPGIMLVLGGLVSFIRFIVICGGIVGVVYFAYINRGKIGEHPKLGRNGDGGEQGTKAHDANIKGNSKVGGEFKYFNIPITKLDQAQKPDLPPRSRFVDVSNLNNRELNQLEIQPQRKIVEEIIDVTPQPLEASMNLDVMGSRTQVMNRNARYDNFVNMAGVKHK